MLRRRGSSAIRLPGWTSSAREGSNASRRKDLCFDAEVDGKRTRMLAARQVLPYLAIVGRNGTGLHVQWDVQVMDPQGSNREQPLPLSNETKTFKKCYHD